MLSFANFLYFHIFVKGEGKHLKPSFIMSNRPRRERKSIFRRDSSPQKETKSKRTSVGRDDLVSKRRNIAEKTKLDESILKTPMLTRVAPVSFTPNPTLAPNLTTRRISISPLGLPTEFPPELDTNWDPSPVVGRRPTPALVSPLWKLADVDLVDETQPCHDPPDLIPLVESDDEGEEEADIMEHNRGDNWFVLEEPPPLCEIEIEEGENEGDVIGIDADKGTSEQTISVPPVSVVSQVSSNVATHPPDVSTTFVGPLIDKNQCYAGQRRDCPKKDTCFFRHCGEIVGEPLTKYVKAREFLQCQYCPKSFSTKRGLKSHTTKANKELVSCSIKTTTAITVPPDDAVHENHDETLNSSIHVWGSYSIEAFSDNLDAVYDKVVFMRQNLFKLPSGGPGKDFVREISRLLSAWNSKSNLKAIAWKCIMVMPTLLLQKPSASSKSRDHKAALQRRLILWQKGDLKELMQECETLQKRLKDSLPEVLKLFLKSSQT